MPAQTKTEVIEVPILKLGQLTVELVGDSSLIVHRWSEKAKKEMLDKQMMKAKGPKEPKDPWGDYISAAYWLDPAQPVAQGKPTSQKSAFAHVTKADVAKATFGFPSIAFKSAAVDACTTTGKDIPKTLARMAFHVLGEFVEIIGHPEMREDMVRIGMGTADLRYRPEFKEWGVKLNVKYNVNVLSVEQIINLINLGGLVGIGENRPQKDGSHGMYHVKMNKAA